MEKKKHMFGGNIMIRFRRSSHLDEAKWLDVFHWIFVENGLSIFIYLVKSSVGQCVCIWQKLCLGRFVCRGNIAIQFNQYSNNFPERLAPTENNTSGETVNVFNHIAVFSYSK